MFGPVKRSGCSDNRRAAVRTILAVAGTNPSTTAGADSGAGRVGDCIFDQVCENLDEACVDAEGRRIGDESKDAQIRKVKLKVSELLLKAILKLNGVNQPAEVAVKKE
jgi:hypothetical protein